MRVPAAAIGLRSRWRWHTVARVPHHPGESLDHYWRRVANTLRGIADEIERTAAAEQEPK